MRVVRGGTVEFSAMVGGMFAAGRRWAVIALTVIEFMIDMAVEVVRTVEPRASADKYAACEPFRAVVSVRRAIVRRLFVVPIRANWRRANLDGNLCGGPVR